MSDKRIITYIVWFLTAFFYAFQFVLRVSPSIMMQDIMDKFNMNAISFGALSAAYYIGYSGMQIPIGIMLDKFKPNKVIAGCMLICVIGTLSFVYANHWLFAVFGRFLIGVGSAAAILGAVKIISVHFSKKRYGFMVGLTVTIGLLGAIYGGAPVHHLVQKYGSNKVLQILALVGAISSILMLILIKDKKVDNNDKEYKGSVFSALSKILRKPRVLLIGIFGGLMVGPLEGFADVWGVAYLAQIWGVTKADAAFAVTRIFLGMCIGSPIIAYLAEEFKCYYALTIVSGLVMALLFLVVLVFHIPYSLLIIVMFIIGILCCYQILVFTFVRDEIEESLVGITTAVINCLIMSFGSIFHPVIGWLMEKNWGHVVVNGERVYDKATFATALSIIPIALAIGFLGFVFLAINRTKMINK
jgi:MFS family permease